MATYIKPESLARPLTEADLDHSIAAAAAAHAAAAARRQAQCPPCHGQCRQGRNCPCGEQSRGVKRAAALGIIALVLALLAWVVLTCPECT